jgi:hypothetical protein
MSADTSIWSATAYAVRATDALLRAQGGASIALRIPAAAADGCDGAQVGLGTSGFQDLALSPAVFRKQRATLGYHDASEFEVLLSATPVAQAVGQLQLSSADALFAQAMAVVIGEKLFVIDSVSNSVANGQVYLYRLLLRAALQQAQ